MNNLEKAIRMRVEAKNRILTMGYTNVAHVADTEQTILKEIARRDAEIALAIAEKLVEYTVTQLIKQGFKAELEKLTATSTSKTYIDENGKHF